MNRSSRIAVASLGVVLSACTHEPTTRSPSEPSVTSAPLHTAASPKASAPRQSAAERAGHEKSADDEAVLLSLLPSAKLDLARGIALAEGDGGRAVSAKFELDGGKLSLSVYMAKKGIEPDAEHNVLAELSGDATQSEWKPKEEIFADTKHITRASYHLTLVQRSKMTLAAVIAKALAQQAGQVYSVEPAIHERSPTFHVLIATSGGGHVKVDVESGA
jgi:hypothetical protein